MGNSSSSSSSQVDSAHGEEAPTGEDEYSTRQMSYWELARYGYAELVNAIIRPPRAEYDVEHLGPEYFEWHERCFRREDLELTNARGHTLACSWWMPVETGGQQAGTARPCLIYMHGNASARVEAIPQLALCLSLGLTLFALDFSGSGKSQGEYVSLGYWEREDLATVIAHLRATGLVSSIALWGRSMGAVTGLMHSSRDPSIAAMICDGAFADLPQLAEELVQRAKDNGLAVPGFVVSLAIRMIRSSVLKTAHFKLEDVSPVKDVDCAFVPALFVAGDHDDFVAPHHSKQIHDKYAGDKNLVIVEGDHNSPRPRFLFDSAAIFLQNYTDLNPALALPGADAFNNGLPPWVHSGAYGLNLADLGLDVGDMDLDSQNLGMTAQRQRHVQQTLHDVFGGNRGSTAVSSRGRRVSHDHGSFPENQQPNSPDDDQGGALRGGGDDSSGFDNHPVESLPDAPPRRSSSLRSGFQQNPPPSGSRPPPPPNPRSRPSS